MPIFTPDQLVTLLTNVTLNIASHLVIDQNLTTRHIPISDLREELLSRTMNDNAFFDMQVNARWISHLNSISNGLNYVASTGHSHISLQVGLGNVQNIAPADMPISIAVQEALSTKKDISNLSPTIGEWVLSVPPQW